jgi:hypothetical protein
MLARGTFTLGSNFAIKIILKKYNQTKFHKKYEAKGVENQKHN